MCRPASTASSDPLSGRAPNMVTAQDTAGRTNADLTAWLAVAAGTLGAFMATLDVSIVNSALPTIQGEIGATGTEGTWIATAYLVAEIIIIPLTAWLEQLLGLRLFLLGATLLFTGFSVLCGISSSLPVMIVGRIGQGLTGGAMIPTAMTIIATRLPRHQQPIGSALFGITAILGPVIGPLIGGWLTENISWHYAFFLNLPVCTALVLLLLLGLPRQGMRLDRLREADWLGIIGLTLGLGALTVLLEEGQRELWLQSPLIIQMALLATLGFALLIVGQVTAPRPVIHLGLLLNGQFGSVAMMGMVVGMVVYGSSYAIRQFLSVVAQYNALQSGTIVLISGIPSLLLMPFTPLMVRAIDIRAALAAGLLMMVASSFLDTDLSSASTGGSFVVSQLLRGAGTIFAFLFLSQAAITSAPAEYTGDASCLFNAVRNLGGSFALAGISAVQDQRTWLHSRRLEEALHANGLMVQEWLAGMTRITGSRVGALEMVSSQVQQQALTMTYNDLFWLLGVGSACVLPLVLFLKPLPKGAALAAMH